MSHIRILHQVKITDRTMFILGNLMERKIGINIKELMEEREVGII